jgi:hypothetical protein
MLKYHVKITDNETGEVLNHLDTNCIIGAFGNEIGALEISVFDCKMISILATVEAALKAVERTCKSDPAIEFVVEEILKKGGVFKDD